MAAGLQWETAAFAYEEHDFSDVELVFVQKQPHRVVEQMEEVQQQQPERGTAIKRRREEPAEQDEQQQSQHDVLHRFPGNTLVLAVHSEYFKVVLSQRWRNEGEGKLDVLCSGPEDLAAAQAVLKVMYTHQLDSASILLDHTSGSQPSQMQILVKMIEWADRWQAAGCLELCLRKLAEWDMAKVGVSDVNALFALPESVNKAAAFGDLRNMLGLWLVDKFADVYAVIVDMELLQSFSELEFPAVLAWAELDELSVQTENDVAVLLALWHSANEEEGRACCEDELLKLGQALRVSNLTPLYRRLTLPEFSWFKGHAAKASVFAALWDNGGAKIIAKAKPELEFPDFWSAEARQGALPDGASDRAIITAFAPEAELGTMLQHNSANMSSAVYGGSTYWHGYFWRASVELVQGDIGGFLNCIRHDPVPAPAFVQYSYVLNGPGDCATFLVREKSGNGKFLLTGFGPITSLAQLQPHFLHGGLEVCFALSDVD